MVANLSGQVPGVGESRERMQRVRVGVTGLAAVVLIVALATAISSGIARSAADAVTAPPPVVATLPSRAANAAEKSEPLAELGVTPDAKDGQPPAKAAN
jgi:cobalamin synthase